VARNRKGKRRRRAQVADVDTGGLNSDALQVLAREQLGPGLVELASQLGGVNRRTEVLSPSARRQARSYGRGKPSGQLAFNTLRAIGDASLINSAIHMRRTDGIRALARPWMGRRTDIGWRVVHKRHHHEGFDATKVDGIEERIRRVETFVDCPHPVFAPNTEDLIIPLLDDRLTIDRPVINLVYDNLGKEPVTMFPVDGATVWPVDVWADQFAAVEDLEDPQSRMRTRDRGYVRAKEVYGVDLTTVAWVQVLPDAGLEPHEFLTADELIVSPSNRTSRIDHYGFGRSPCERSWVASTIYLFGIGYVLDFFQNSFSNMLGTLKGVKETDAVTIVNMLRTQHQGPGRMFHTPMIPLPHNGSIEMIPTRRATAQDMAFSETIHHVAGLVCAHYSEDLESLNLPTNSGGRVALSAPNRDRVMDIKRSEGLVNDGRAICRMLTRAVERIDPDLMVIWEGIEDEAEGQELELRAKRLEAGIISENEARIEEGRQPYEDAIHDHPRWRSQKEIDSRLREEEQAVQLALAAQAPPQFDEGAGDYEPEEGDEQLELELDDDEDQKSIPVLACESSVSL